MDILSKLTLHSFRSLYLLLRFVSTYMDAQPPANPLVDLEILALAFENIFATVGFLGI